MIYYLLGLATLPVLFGVLAAVVMLCDQSGLTDWWHEGVHQGRYVRRARHGPSDVTCGQVPISSGASVDERT